MSRVKYLRQSIFPARFGITTDHGAYRRTLKRLKCDMEISETNSMCAETMGFISGDKAGRHYVIMYFNLARHDNIAEFVDTIAHECTHAWQAVREHMGEDNAGRETEAYMIGWLTGQVLKLAIPSMGHKVGRLETCV